MPELQDVFSLGLGAVIAVIVLNWKRADDSAYRQQLLDIIARQTTEKERQDKKEERMLAVIESNTLTLRSLEVAINGLSVLTKLEERLRNLESGGRGPAER